MLSGHQTLRAMFESQRRTISHSKDKQSSWVSGEQPWCHDDSLERAIISSMFWHQSHDAVGASENQDALVRYENLVMSIIEDSKSDLGADCVEHIACNFGQWELEFHATPTQSHATDTYTFCFRRNEIPSMLLASKLKIQTMNERSFWEQNYLIG